MASLSKRYRAFISYSQSDSRQAQLLHRALENYRVPLGIAPDVVDAKTRRLGRFFRDTEEMAAATDISATVRGAIEDSDSLIVVCSPRSAASRWVNSEVDHFRGTGRGDRIYAVIIDGEPNSGDPAAECFPPTLRVDALGDHGPGSMPVEPLGIDMRKEPLDRVCARIAAGLLNVPFDDLWRRDRRERQRRLMLAGGAAAVVLLLGVGVMTAVWSGQERTAGAKRSAQLAEAARLASDAGFHDRAARYALAGLKGASNPLTGFDARESEIELRRALMGGLDFVVAEKAAQSLPADSGEVFTGVSFSPDGGRILAGTAAGEAQMWDAATGKPLAVFGGHRGSVIGRFSPDGSRIVTIGQEGGGRLWDGVTGREVVMLTDEDGDLSNVQFSSDGSRFVTARDLQLVTAWDTATGAKIAEIPLPGTFSAAMMTGDGGDILISMNQGSLARWSVETGRRIDEWRLPRDARLILNPAGDRFLRVSQSDTDLHLTDLAGRRLRSFSNADHAVSSMAFSADGALIVAGSYGGDIDIYGVASGKLLTSWSAGAEELTRVAFDGVGGRILVETASQAPVIWTVDGTKLATLSGATGFPAGSALSVDGRRAVAATTDGAVRAWSLGGEGEGTLLAVGADLDAAPVFSADGARVAIPLAEGGVSIVSLATARATGRFGESEAPVTDLAFSPDGAQLLGLTNEGIAVVWDIATAKVIARASSNTALALTWSGAGPRVVVYGADGVEVVDVVRDQHVALPMLTQNSAAVVVVSPDGARLAAFSIATDGLEDPDSGERAQTAFVVDAGTGRDIAELRGHQGPLFDLAFSHDGTLIASTSSDQTVRLWKAENGRQGQQFDGLPRPEGRPVFTPDDRLLAVPTSDYTIRLMNLADHAMRTLGGHEAHITQLNFNADGTLLVSASQDGSARLWDVVSGREVARFRHAAGGVWYAGFASDGRLVTVALGGEVRIRELPAALMQTRGELVERACDRMLLDGFDRFSAEEMRRAPLLDVKRDASACAAR